MSVVYLDSSAIVKLVMAEDESRALRRFLGRRPLRASTVLARVEVGRAIRGQGQRAAVRLRELLKRIDLVSIDDEIMERAIAIDPPTVRSLDAIHLASALSLRGDLSVLVTYDDRQADGARALGVRVEAPR